MEFRFWKLEKESDPQGEHGLLLSFCIRLRALSMSSLVVHALTVSRRKVIDLYCFI